MINLKCRFCGGALEITDPNAKIIKCEYCDRTVILPSLDNEKKLNLFSRANRLRLSNEFDKAAGVFENIVAEFPEEAEAYWGLCLCKYGIEYVDDPASGVRIPTCHRTSYDSIFEDSNFEQACENADAVAVKMYREEAKEIDRIQKSILEIVQKEDPYDIFICYKETADDGQRTEDSVMAQDIYDALTAKGFKVFFSRITLEDKLGKAYEPYIFSALSTSKVMLAVGSKFEYYNAVWVKNEWSRFLAMMKKDREKVLIPCYRDIDAYDMPAEFRNLQGQDMSKVGAMQDLVRAVGKIVRPEEPKTIIKEVIRGGDVATIESRMKRAYLYLEDRDWKKADEYFDQILDINPEYAEAYLGKLLAATEISSREKAGDSPTFFTYVRADSSLWGKAYQFGDQALQDEIGDLLSQSEAKWHETNYNNAINEMNKKTVISYDAAIKYLNAIPNYKDSKELKAQCIDFIVEQEINSEKAEITYNLEKSKVNLRECEGGLTAAKAIKSIGFYGISLFAFIILMAIGIVSLVKGDDSMDMLNKNVCIFIAYILLLIVTIKENGLGGIVTYFFTAGLCGLYYMIVGFSYERSSKKSEVDKCQRNLAEANAQIKTWQEKLDRLPEKEKTLREQKTKEYEKVSFKTQTAKNNTVNESQKPASVNNEAHNPPADPITALMQEHSSGKDIIKNFMSIGSNDSSNPFPKGSYSSNISISRFSVVHFHIKLKNPAGYSGKGIINLVIFDEYQNIVFDHHSEIDVQPNYDTFSSGWILKGDDGSSISTGTYTLVGWFNNSRCIKYIFKVSK